MKEELINKLFVELTEDNRNTLILMAKAMEVAQENKERKE